MKSLGERLLELRERYVSTPLGYVPQEYEDAVFQQPNYPDHIDDYELRVTVAIERAAVRELKKEGKL